MVIAQHFTTRLARVFRDTHAGISHPFASFIVNVRCLPPQVAENAKACSCLSSLRVERIAGERQDASTAAVRIGRIATSGHALANTIRLTRASDDLQDQQWGISVVACVGVLSTGHSVGCQVDPGYENSEEQPRITRSFLNVTRKLGAELLSRDICKHLLAPHAC
jgi:hypothetical protein